MKALCFLDTSVFTIRHGVTLLIYYYYLLTHSLTAIGLSPGGSSPTLVQTKIKIHKTTKQLQNLKKHKTTITTKKQLQNIKNTKQQNNYKAIKISTQTEHRICKYVHITKTHTKTRYKTYEIKTTIVQDT